MTEAQKEIARKRYKAGIGLREIGREIGFSHVAVRKFVLREEIIRPDLNFKFKVTNKLPIVAVGNLPTVAAVTAYLVDSGMKENSIRNVQRILDAIKELVGGTATKQ